MEDADTVKTSRSLRILVAEDNRVNQMVVQAMLEEANHSVHMVCNGLEAVTAVRDHPYDLLLMDEQMPEMDGITAARKIRELPGAVRNIPIVALTTNSRKGDQESYLATGMTDYLAKPVKPKDLFVTIARWAAGEGPA